MVDFLHVNLVLLDNVLSTAAFSALVRKSVWLNLVGNR